jgi:hypothetical protein
MRIRSRGKVGAVTVIADAARLTRLGLASRDKS